MSEDSDLALEVLLDFFNAVEAGITQARQTIKKRKLEEKSQPTWNPDRIKWCKAEGPSGPYEKASVEENQGNKDFEALLADLNAHGGKMTKNGFFLWLFTNSDAVGRKRRV